MRLLALNLSLLLASWQSAAARTHEVAFDQAKAVVDLVARHDHIVVDDRTIVMNSMDVRNPSGFIPGYYSFSIVRESDSASRSDETIRMYAVSKKTGETWEINLCTHYSFPRLQAMQDKIMQQTGATAADSLLMSKDIGCATQAQMKALADGN